MTDAPQPSASESKRWTACLPIFLGGVAALLVMSALALGWLVYHRIPPLDESAFVAAEQQWREAAIRDYEIQIEVTGRQPATYRVVVHDGEPVLAERNGFPLPQRRTWHTWTVPGMFGTIRRDLFSERRIGGQNRGGEPPSLLVRTEFDPQLGIPRRYLRVELGQDMDVSWKVTRFDRKVIPANEEILSP